MKVEHPLHAVTRMYGDGNRSINIVHLSSPELESFYRAEKQLRYSCGEDYGNNFWEPLKKIFRTYEYEHVLAPLRLDSIGSLDVDQLETAKAQFEFTDQIYPGKAQFVNDFFVSLDRCLASGSGPLSAGVLQALDKHSNENGVVILRKSFLDIAYNALIEGGVQLSPEQVITPREIRDDNKYGNLFILSNPYLLKRYGFEWVLRSPRASSNTLITFDFFDFKWKPEPTFPSQNSPNPVRIRYSFSMEPGSEESFGKPLNTSLIREPLNPGSLDQTADEQINKFKGDPTLTYNAQPEFISCRLFLLHGDKGVWLEEDASSYVIDLEPGSPNMYGRRLHVGDLSTGMFYLYREEEGDFVPDLADQILTTKYGDSRPFRSAQSFWKERLRQLVRIDGIPRVIAYLKKNGCDIANAPNLRNWMSERTIRTKAKGDFEAILSSIGLEDELEDYWEKMRVIASAHREAGKEVGSRLRNSIANSNASAKMQRLGHYEFDIDLPKTGSLVAREITDRSVGTSNIKASDVDEVFDLEGLEDG